MPKPKDKRNTNSLTEYQIMYEKDLDETTRLFYVTTTSVEDAIQYFRQSHFTEEILDVVKL